MKPISASVFVGVLLAFVVIYILRPLGPGAVALVVILCVGLCATIGGVVAALFKKKNESVAVTLLLSCARGPVAVRAYLFSGEPTPPGYGAYGYLVFNAQPSESESKRYQRVCDSFRRQLAVETWGTEGQRGNQMATFWPLKIARSTEVNSWQCQKLIENYDYRKSAEIATVIHKQAASGPVLAAWKKPFEENGSSEALVLDLSDFADEDLDRAFGIWRDRITRDPAVWRGGFKVVLCREAMRNLLQKYGDTVLAVINPTKSKH